MHDVAAVRSSLPPGSHVARAVALSGFGSRHAGEAVALGPDGTVLAGRLLAGLVDEALRARLGRNGAFETTVADPEAEAAGMACGGRARVLLQPVESIDEETWRRLAAERPVVLATALDTGATRVVTDDGAQGTTGHDDTEADAIATALLRSGQSTTEVTAELLVESYLPPTTVHIVGRAAVGDALAAQATLLGWDHATLDDPHAAAEAAGSMASHDALVVLSHDADVDTPALAAALEHGRGYVGALGSRGTQTARRERLRSMGFGDAQLATIHGPVGLDLGARTPAETAVAIVAEILAHRSGRDAASLHAGDGPING